MLKTTLTKEELIDHKVIRNKWLLIGGFSIVHLLATIISILCSMGSMSRFETGRAETLAEALLERASLVISHILMFPFYQVFEFFHLFKLHLGILPIVANSLLWAVCFYGALRVILRRRARARA